ncbi:DUF3253 domain-containing protein [Sphingomonas astaxanthinifaciens]|uniref:DUF3253 domain-containing protein n=1 Tax=Sphingomonas astaxanthinifaciens DSM 22298 TaxID=1123267 RepID=A0ABQ5Z9R3_9SPHN|nr:DUF3253 domain-containing protein [Sphingomonas astaxanthinifaciens]GLR48372.1 hypothetical protein GCM10007925_20870 [Sphingomonas astaxanthinifaciens DSM 22298]
MTAEARQTTLALLTSRAPGGTICPSEVARAIASDGDWRAAMPMVHGAVNRLLAEGAIRLSWKGQRLTARAGPYRVAMNIRTRD